MMLACGTGMYKAPFAEPTCARLSPSQVVEVCALWLKFQFCSSGTQTGRSRWFTVDAL
jgi:hypothetical protein